MKLMSIDEQEDYWITRLREQCGLTSQAQVAREIGFSGAVVSLVLKGTYETKGGDITKVEKAFRGVFLGATVNCPVAGELEANICLENQKRKRANNSAQVRLIKACRNCPNSHHSKKELMQ
jgi:hypothetical protein